MQRLTRSRRLRAARFGRYPSSSMAWRTRAAVSGATRDGALSTFDTVCRETPAAAATSEIVTAPAITPPRLTLMFRPDPADLIVQILTGRATCQGGVANPFPRRYQGTGGQFDLSAGERVPEGALMLGRELGVRDGRRPPAGA